MRKLLSSPLKMNLSDSDNINYQNILKHVPDILLNLMAIKVENRPENFLDWCNELLRLCKHQLNLELLEQSKLPTLKKLQTALEQAISFAQLRMLRIAPWPIFHDFITQCSLKQSVEERLSLLAYIEQIKQTPLAEMIEEDRLAMAGKHTIKHDTSVYKFDCEWFCSTKTSTVFHQLLTQYPEKFDQALAHIPINGEISTLHYQAFVAAYSEIFKIYAADEKITLSAATRLLAMRRPDQFVAFPNKKIDVMCQAFGIAKFNNTDFDSYWYDLIATMRTFSWWKSDAPETQNELTLWQVRAILIDLYFYCDDEQASQSNYIKQISKQKNVNTITSSVPKRSKASIEELVDRALLDSDLPEFIIKKRDSIVHQVQNGKSIEQVITLMKAIFS
ncbi:hypothetical protein AAD001_03400 [Colwelliaceae bacterium 6471]